MSKKLLTAEMKFRLANKIRTDKTLTPVTRLIGIHIADFVNLERGYAWCTQEQIAADLGISRRTVMRAIKDLGGHFRIDRSGRANEYRPAIGDKNDAIGDRNDTYPPTDRGHLRHRKVTKTTKIGDTGVTPSLEILLDPLKRAPAMPKPRKKPATELPDDWLPKAPSLEQGQKLGLSVAEIDRESKKFRNHARQNARTAVRWDAAFDNWLIKAAEFLNRSPPADGDQPATFSASPNTPEFQAWRSHFRDAGQGAMVRELDKRQEEGRAFRFEAQWPPGERR